MSQGQCDCPVDLSICGFNVIDLGLVASDRLVAVELKVEIAASDCMMDKLIRAQCSGGRVPCNEDHRYVWRKEAREDQRVLMKRWVFFHLLHRRQQLRLCTRGSRRHKW